MSNTAYIYDAVRTPRSKGKPGGTLHEVKPIDLGAGILRALQERNDLIRPMWTTSSWGVYHLWVSRAAT